MGPTKIINCSCKHEFQDKIYGRGKRVANYCRAKNVYKCTVCRTDIDAGRVLEKENKR